MPYLQASKRIQYFHGMILEGAQEQRNIRLTKKLAIGYQSIKIFTTT
jgi:hypothetical protein